MNEENLERDRATQVYSRRLVPPRYTPEGDSPLSLYGTVLSSRVVLSSVSRHRAGVRATVPAVQVRGDMAPAGVPNRPDWEGESVVYWYSFSNPRTRCTSVNEKGI